MISERLFNLFDVDNDGYLSLEEFINGMFSLFTASFSKLIVTMFKVYDFDNNGFVGREDLKAIFSHFPILNETTSSLYKFKFEKDEFEHRIESQMEIFKYSNSMFGSKDYINLDQYQEIVKNISSESFVYVSRII